MPAHTAIHPAGKVQGKDVQSVEFGPDGDSMRRKYDKWKGIRKGEKEGGISKPAAAKALKSGTVDARRGARVYGGSSCYEGGVFLK